MTKIVLERITETREVFELKIGEGIINHINMKLSKNGLDTITEEELLKVLDPNIDEDEAFFKKYYSDTHLFFGFRETLGIIIENILTDYMTDLEADEIETEEISETLTLKGKEDK